jgi:hypothetical protein
MKTMLIATAAAAAGLALAFASSFALADGPRASSGTTVRNAAEAEFSTGGAPPHYEWQYHYTGRHARFEGHWVLVR